MHNMTYHISPFSVKVTHIHSVLSETAHSSPQTVFWFLSILHVLLSFACKINCSIHVPVWMSLSSPYRAIKMDKPIVHDWSKFLHYNLVFTWTSCSEGFWSNHEKIMILKGMDLSIYLNYLLNCLNLHL